MTASEKAKFRRVLLEERERIADGWTQHAGGGGPEEGWNLRDMEDRAGLNPVETVERRISNDAANLLQKVEFALQRLEENTYHICAECGGEIPVARLMAKPSVSLCIACQEKKDARRR